MLHICYTFILFQNEIDQDRRVLKKHVNDLNEKLINYERLFGKVFGEQMNLPVPEKMLKQIKVPTLIIIKL